MVRLSAYGVLALASPRFDTVRRVQLRTLVEGFLRSRPWFALPGAVPGFVAIALAEIPPAQKLVHLGFLVGFVVEALAWSVASRLRLRRLADKFLIANLGHAVLIAGVLTLSGGLDSPFLALFVTPVANAFATFGRARGSGTVVLVSLALLSLLLFLPAGFPWPPFPEGTQRFLTAWCLAFTLVNSLIDIATITGAFRRSTEVLARMRQGVAEEIAARTKGLETLGARLAREVEEPLQRLRAELDGAAARSTGDERFARRVTVIRNELERMEGILADYLHFARPFEDLSSEPVDLRRLADDVLAVVEVRAADAGLEVRASGPSVVVAADPRRLKEALLNLVANAIEATPRGGRVEVRVAAEPRHARVVVEDTGRGMPREQLAKVGTPFFTTRSEGTGLGVALAQAVASAHGGSLRYESERDQGTRATLTLPHAQTEAR